VARSPIDGGNLGSRRFAVAIFSHAHSELRSGHIRAKRAFMFMQTPASPKQPKASRKKEAP